MSNPGHGPAIVISPHNDDEALFVNYTIQRERAIVVVVFDSYIQVERGNPHCDWKTRRNETQEAMKISGAGGVEFLGVHDDAPTGEFWQVADLRTGVNLALQGVIAKYGEDIRVWSPAFEDGGHVQHNIVALACDDVFGDRIQRYLTYTRDKGRSKSSLYNCAGGDFVLLANKLSALACYRTQIETPRLGCYPHFLQVLGDSNEYFQVRS